MWTYEHLQWLVRHLLEVKWPQGLAAVLRPSQASPAAFQTTEALFLSQSTEKQVEFVRELLKLSSEHPTGDLHKELAECLGGKTFVLHSAFIYVTTEGQMEPAALQAFLTKNQSELGKQGPLMCFMDGGDHWEQLRAGL